jgi:hypothetical protein
MKNIFALQMIISLIFISCLSISPASGHELMPSGINDLLQTTNQNVTTITVTIVKIDTSTRTVTLKDQNGKIYVFVLDSNSTIDLSKFKVGQTVTASISTTYLTDKVTRARITKTQLIKLQ